MDDVSSAVKEEILDCKSSEIYHRWKKRYDAFKSSKGYSEDSLGVFMDYIRSLKDGYKLSSIWQAASCINKFLRVEKNMNFISSMIFKSYMKKLEKCPRNVKKKAGILDVACINRYILESEKTAQNLLVGLYMNFLVLFLSCLCF